MVSEVPRMTELSLVPLVHEVSEVPDVTAVPLVTEVSLGASSAPSA